MSLPFRLLISSLALTASLAVAAPLDFSFTSGLKESNANTLDVNITGTTATLLDSRGLQFVDVTDPNAPVTLADFTSSPAFGLLGNCSDMVRVGDLVFLATGLEGLSIVNAANPSVPVEIERQRFPLILPDNSVGYSLALSVAVSGNYAYVGTASHGLQVLDITDPANAVPVASFPMIDPAINLSRASYDLAIRGNTLFIANHLQGLRVLNISNPLAPTQLALINFGSARAYNVLVNGNTLYVSTQENGLRVYNITIPATPVLQTTVELPGDGPGTLFLDGSTLYTGTSSSGICALDVSNPSLPVLTGRSPVDWGLDSFGFPLFSAKAGTVANGYLYAALGEENLRIFKLEGASRFTKTGRLTGAFFDQPTTDVACTATHAFVAQGSQGIRSISLANPAAPQILTTYASTSTAHAVALSGTTLYAATGRTGVVVLNAANPAALTALGAYDPDGDGTATSPGDALGIQVSGTTVDLANGPAGISILNLTNPAAGRVTGSYNTDGSAIATARMGNTLFVADGAVLRNNANIPIGGGLVALDIRNPAAPSLIFTEQLDLNDAGEVFVAKPGLLCVGDRALGQVLFYDVSQPSAPVLLGRKLVGAPPVSMTARGNLLYVGLKGAGVVLFDIANPSLPVRVSGFQLAGGDAVAFSADQLCVAEGNTSFTSAATEIFAVLTTGGPPAAAPPVLGNLRLSGANCVLDFTGAAGQSWHLARSSNLSTWTVLRTVTGTGGTVQETDPVLPNTLRIFYRLQTIP